MVYLTVALGLVLLLGGGEALVRGAVALAARLGVSPLMIGLTVVGFGTSTPELVTSLQAAFAGAPGVAVGNVVGSNVANVLLILGVAAVIAPLAAAAPRRDLWALALSAGAAAAVIRADALGRPVGLALLAGLALWLLLAWRQERGAAPGGASGDAPAAMGAVPALALTAGGIAVTMLGARFLVAGATELATGWGISEAAIGLTVVAVGTSLPELVASVAAARRGQGALALGNVVGSNVYNVLGILGATALVRPIPAPAGIGPDLLVMLGATALLVLFALRPVGRGAGAALLLAYAGYVAWLMLRGAAA
ncbi:cation:H+ antiporter [Hasllibacter halocynthiae]|uniref:Cation:H+ antiporter n=1 Tax=Hasllibacter halocynthiae TaxID=595589 RepID=A0A2T0X1R4_9RHOB|nr:calcium/sodium antiporter [Hasllibacter halocynthiae]PRY92857.1 cation:H+ antiporter [Hasllibacter halocynthiae]